MPANFTADDFPPRTSGLVVLAAAVALAIITTGSYVQARGLLYFEKGNQLERHRRILAGTAGDPWQYRVLSAFALEGAIRVLSAMDAPYPNTTAFIAFRYTIDVALLLAAAIFYRRLGLSLHHTLLGMMLLAWGVSYSHFDSDLQFSTFIDVLFYLISGSVIIAGRIGWVPLLAVLAATNRETSGLIPMMLLATALGGRPDVPRKRTATVGAVSLALYAATLIVLRLGYGSQRSLVPLGHAMGWDLFIYNILRPITWWQTLLTVGLLPFFAISGRRYWPPIMKTFFWTVVPAWIGIHLAAAVVAESRLLLVPQALVFIPGALLVAQYSTKEMMNMRDRVDGMRSATKQIE